MLHETLVKSLCRECSQHAFCCMKVQHVLTRACFSRWTHTAERRRRFRARVIGQRNQQAVASTAKDIRGQVCGEMAEAKADMPNASVMPRIPPLTSKGDKACMDESFAGALCV